MTTETQRQKVLSEETLNMLNPKGVEFLKYDMRLKDHVVLVCDAEQRVEGLGYQKLTMKEAKDNGLDIYDGKTLYKISEKELLQRHSLL